MGSDDGRSNEQPVHTVYLDTFFIDRNEVTNAQFTRFLNEMGNQEEDGESWLDIDDEDCRIVERGGEFVPKSGFADHPVIEVSWYGARAYCEWRSLSTPEQIRLPTEAEWEKAASWDPETGLSLVYPWGNEWDANKTNADIPILTVTEVGIHTLPVGSLPEGASPSGVLDMAGNVWEWVADWYDGDYYDNSPAENPKGSDTGEERVRKGGSWRSNSSFVRTALRDKFYPSYTWDIGFRCAYSP